MEGGELGPQVDRARRLLHPPGRESAQWDEVMVANSSFHRSTDGGLTFPDTGGCGDCHDIWLDPTNPDRWALTDDAGMSITTDHAKHYQRITLPLGQMYHVAGDTQVPYWIYTNRQDDGT